MDEGVSGDIAGRVFWAVVVGFLVGVFARAVFPLGSSFAAFLCVVALAVLILAAFEKHTFRNSVIFAALLFACALGLMRMHVAVLSGDPALTAHLNESVLIEGVVVAEPDVRDSSVRVAIAATHLSTSKVSTKVSSGILAVLPAHADVWYGEHVRAFGTLRAPQPFDTGSGQQFAYPQYLASQGITYELALAQAEQELGVANTGDPLQAAAIAIKGAFLKGVAATLPEPEAGLGGGITVGDKRSIGPELSNVFQEVGLVHVVVLSGYNITVVLSAAAKLLEWAPRFVQFGASGFIVLLFILMAGGAGSATRAGVMALVAVLARATGRTFLASRALAVAALLIVLWNPFELVFDPSFQLSALATLGLIVFTPVFAAYLQRVPEKFGMREIVTSTLGTQTAVLPLMLYQNGLFPLYALPANAFALVVVPLAMLFTSIAGVCGIAVGSLAVPVAFPAYILLTYIIDVARLFSALPFAAISIGSFSVWWMLAIYAFLFGGAWLVHKKGGTPFGSPAKKT